MHNSDIRCRRRAAKITQSQIAEEMGLDQPTISRLERHAADYLRRMAQRMGCKAADLLAS